MVGNRGNFRLTILKIFSARLLRAFKILSCHLNFNEDGTFLRFIRRQNSLFYFLAMT